MEKKFKNDETFIAKYKRKIEILAPEVEINLKDSVRKIEFSAKEIEVNSYNELVKIVSQLPVGGVLIYADKNEIAKIQENLLKAGITAICNTEDNKEIREGYKRLVSAESVKTDRENLRAIIFYGMSKHIVKLYEESIKLGRDGKPSKCIILWRALDPVRIQKRILACDVWESVEEYLEHNKYCLAMLDSMMEYCQTDLCRRSMIRKYFNVDHAQKEIYHDTCCDNCQKIIIDKVAPSILFKNVSESNTLDISDEARMMLNCLNHCEFDFTECVAILRGKMHIFRKPQSLDLFGAGKSKPEVFWLSIYQRLIEKKFRQYGSQLSTLSKIAQQFLRRKKSTLDMPVQACIKGCLEKKDIYVSLENGAVWVSPKEEVIYEDVKDDDMKKTVIWSQTAKIKSESNQLFDFEVTPNVVLKRSPKKKTEEVTPAPPKSDWREAFAARVARKDNENVFKPVESLKVNEQQEMHDDTSNKDINLPQPGCSHWSTTAIENASTDSSNSFLLSIEEEEIDDEYVENMRQTRELMHKPLTVPLFDLLDYIEAQTSLLTGEQTTLKRAISSDNFEEWRAQKVMRNK